MKELTVQDGGDKLKVLSREEVRREVHAPKMPNEQPENITLYTFKITITERK